MTMKPYEYLALPIEDTAQHLLNNAHVELAAPDQSLLSTLAGRPAPKPTKVRVGDVLDDLGGMVVQDPKDATKFAVNGPLASTHNSMGTYVDHVNNGGKLEGTTLTQAGTLHDNVTPHLEHANRTVQLAKEVPLAAVNGKMESEFTHNSLRDRLGELAASRDGTKHLQDHFGLDLSTHAGGEVKLNVAGTDHVIGTYDKGTKAFTANKPNIEAATKAIDTKKTAVHGSVDTRVKAGTDLLPHVEPHVNAAKARHDDLAKALNREPVALKSIGSVASSAKASMNPAIYEKLPFYKKQYENVRGNLRGGFVSKAKVAVGAIGLGKGAYDIFTGITSSQEDLDKSGSSRFSKIGLGLVEAGVGLGVATWGGKAHVIGRG